MRVDFYIYSLHEVSVWEYIWKALQRRGVEACFILEPPGVHTAYGSRSDKANGYLDDKRSGSLVPLMIPENHARIAAYLNQCGYPFELRGEPLADVVVTTQGVGWLRRYKKLKVRTMYGVGAVRNSFGHGEINKGLDAVLVHGEFSRECIEKWLPRDKIRVAGFPKYSPYFRGEVDAGLWAERFGLDPEKKTIAYLSTWAQNSSLDRYSEALVSLAGRYNVLLKPHHNTLLFEEDRIDALRERGVRIVEDIPTIVPFYAVADLVLADVRSGSFTEAFLMDRRVIGLSPHGDPEQDALIEQAYKAAPICSDPAALEDLIGQSIEMDVYREGRRALAGYLFTTFDGMDDEVAAEEIISLVPRAKVSEAKPGAEARKSGNGQSFSQVLPAAQPGAASARPLSIIIPTYNRADILKMCLDALAIQTYPPEKFEVLVCDDGSTDDTAQMVQSLRMPYRLTYLRQENRGPAAARNMGIRQAEGEYLLILNDDAILEPDVVERHMDHQQLFAGEKVAVLGKFALRPSFTSTPLGYLLEHSDILFWYNRMEPGKFYDYHHFYTCNISLPRQAVLDVGLFDEDFTGPAAEDLELGYRLHQQGYRVYYDTGAVAWHEHELTPAGLCRTQKARGMGAVTLMVKHPEAPFYKNHDFGATEQWRAENQASAPKAAEILQAVEEFNRGFRTNGDPRALEKAAENLYPLVKYLHRYYEREGLLASDWLDRLIELRTGKQPLVEQPKVSVVIPCYNYGRFLAEAVESVLSQSYQNFEILIVNDGSTDNSHEVAEAIIAAHPEARIMLIDQPNSGQPAISRNNGILKADGDYILPLDADDRLAPGALEAFVRAAQSAASPEVVVFGSVQRFGVEDHLWGTRLFEPRELLVRDMLGYCSLYSRSVWEKQGGYKTNVPGYEDWDFWIGALQVGAKFVHVPQVTLHYRRTGEGSLIDRARLKHEWLYAGIIHNHRELFHPAAVAWAQDYLKDHPQPPAERSPHGPEGRYPDIRARLIGAYPEYYSAEERKWARAYLASNPLAATLHRPQTGASPEAEKQPVEQYEEEADALDLSMRFFQKAQEEFRAERPNQAQVWMQRYRRGVNYNLFPRRDYRKEGAPRISVVIVAYETRKLLLECLDGLMKQSDPDFELILVDNGGNEEVHDRLPAYSPLHIQCPHNLVPSEGRNIGVYFSRGEIIAFLDDDARVPPDYIESIRKAFDRYHLLGLRGKVLPKSASGRQVNAGHYDLGDQPLPSSIDTEGNSAFLKRVYLGMGGMDPLLFGMEGLDLSFRIAQKYGQFSLFYWPETVIFHDYAGTDQKLQAKTERHERMKKYLLGKYPKIYEYHQRLANLAASLEGRKFGSSLLIERGKGPRFSICIPTYNRAHFIRDAIESALNQNYPAAEILIVDDGSTDDTAEMVTPYLSDTVRYIQKEHSGAPETRNRLIHEARGEFLVWLDSDDVLLPDTLRLYASALNNYPDVDVLYGDLILTDANLQPKSAQKMQDWYGREDELISALLRHDAVPNPGTCVKKDVYNRLGGYNPEFVRAHDYEFWSRLAGTAKFKHVNNFVCKWRWHDSNISSGTVKRDTRYEAEIVKKMLKRHTLRQLFPAIDWDRMPRKHAEATAYYQVAQILLNYGAVTGARAFLKKSYRCAQSTEVEGLLKALNGKKDCTVFYPQSVRAQAAPEPAAQAESRPAAPAQTPTGQVLGEKERKRILFIVHNFPPNNLAGTELYTFQLAQKLQASGWDIRVLYPEFNLSRPDGALTHDQYQGIPVVRLNLRPAQEIRELFNRDDVGNYLAAYLRENPVDIVHVHHLQGMGAEVLRAVKEAGSSLVMTLHDAWFLCDAIHLIHADGSYCQGGPETAKKCVHCFAKRNPKLPVMSHLSAVEAAFTQRKRYLKEVLSWVDILLTPSVFLRDLFERHGYTHPDFRLSPLGLEPFQALPHRSPNGKLRLVYLGNIFHTKGLDLAVEAFNQLSSQEARLDIFGQVSDLQYFERVMAAVKPELKVSYRGSYQPADLPQILAQADIAVVPSRIESYSLVIRECLQAGVPVIGPDIGAVPEVIRDGENGLLFRAGDASDLAEKMRYFAVQPRRVEAFRKRIQPVWTIGEDAEALEAIYTRALDGKRQQPPDLSSAQPVVLQRASHSREAQVDIVVPVYGQAALLRRCVESVLRTAPEAHLILVDDCSPGDEIKTLFASWAGLPQVTLARTGVNSGFIGACKAGAALGQAPFILFLNSDTEALTPGWLQRMIPEQERVAIVGAKLLYPPDMPGPLAGSIQHAGVARNAEGIPYHPFLGRPADLPEANEPRLVNAVTGACFLIRRKVWDELGGWDPRFGKGVYEDVDLCWQARQKGYRVLYQPEVELRHYESASKSTGGEHLLNAHTRENLQKLLDKWNPSRNGALPADEELFFGEKTIRRWKRALKELRRAVAAQEAGNPAAFRSALKKAEDLGSDQPEALAGCARLLSKQGENQEAARLLERALQFAPADWDLRARLVQTCLEAGMLETAARELEKLLAVFPNHAQLQELAARLGLPAGEPAGAGVEAMPPAETISSASRAAETLELLLNSDDLLAALQEYAGLLDAELLDLVRQNARAARADGDEELAAGLDDLADYIEGVLAERDTPAEGGAAEARDPHSRAQETLALLLEAEDLPAALEAYAGRMDAALLDLVRLNARTARQDGSLELAEGLEALAEVVQEIIQLRV